MSEIAAEFLRQGVFHIWAGWDHLAFVLCLCLLASGRQLIGLVTAFTIGHSISLALVFYQLANIPASPVEIAIALSIVFMAREALHATGVITNPNVLNRHLLVVLLFGFVHGLGFGDGLDEFARLPHGAGHVSSLIFFNLGIELGELVFVGLITTLTAGLKAIARWQPVRTAALYGTGAMGAFWMVQRAFDLGMA